MCYYLSLTSTKPNSKENYNTTKVSEELLNDKEILQLKKGHSRKVRFSDRNSISFIDSRSQLSKEEKDDVWYKSTNFTQFIIDSHVVASSARQNETHPEKHLLKAYRAVERGKERSAVMLLKKWFESADPSISYRGVEAMCNQEFLDITDFDQRTAVRTVLQAQNQSREVIQFTDQPKNSKLADSEQLRKISEEASMKSRKLAQAMGLVDSMEVNEQTGVKSRNFVKRISNILRRKKTIIPVLC